MIEKTSLREEKKKIFQLAKGYVRATTLQGHFNYIREKEGKEGTKKVQEKLKELGCYTEPWELDPLAWIPLAKVDFVILVAKDVFNWTEEVIFEMGNFAPKYSFIAKILMKTFLSLKRTFQESPKYWKKHYTSGELIPYKIDKKEKYLILRLKHSCHPLLCIFYKGYFLRITQYVIESKEITVKETKCMSKGASYHEFVISWK